MNYGIVAAAQPQLESSPDIDYVTSAVHFGGSAYLTRGSALTGWGTPSSFVAVVWTKLSSCLDGIFTDTGDFTGGCTSDGLGHTYLSFNPAGGYFDAFGGVASNIVATSSGWQSVLVSANLASAPAISVWMYSGDTDILDHDNVSGSNSTMDVGSDFWFGQDGYDYGKIVGDVADFRMWVGHYLDFSVVNNRRLFIRSNGKPADPSLATAVLGTPIISFIADPDVTDPISAFVTNGGTGGDFTLTGSLTTASTSPTD